MTIKLKITNEDADESRAVEISRRRGSGHEVLVTLGPGESTEQHIWRDTHIHACEVIRQPKKFHDRPDHMGPNTISR